MSRIKIPDSDDVPRNVDTFTRQEAGEEVLTQAVAVVDPDNGNPARPDAQGRMPIRADALPLPAGAATQDTLAQLLSAINTLQSTVAALNAKVVQADTGNIMGVVGVANFPATQAVSFSWQGLTDAQLRAAAVPVSFSWQGLTDTQLRAAAVPVSFTWQGLTDAQLRAAAVPVSFTWQGLTDAQLRAAALPVSLAAVPLPNGAATEATVAALNAKTPALGPAAPANAQPVVVANDLTVLSTAAQSALNIDLLTETANGWFDVRAFHSVSLQVIGGAGITAGAVIFEHTNDPTNASAGRPWLLQEHDVLNTNPQGGAVTIAANTQRMFEGAVTAAFVRVRTSTAFVGGTVRVAAVFSQLPYQATRFNVQQATAGSLQMTADTELPAAAALADAAGNPTSPIAGAAALAFNNASWDRVRNNLAISLEASSAKTANGNSASALTNFNARGVQLFVNVSAATGAAPTLVVRVQVQDPVSSSWVDLPGAATASITGVGLTLLTIYPGIAAVANSAVNMPLPRTWRLAWVVGGTTPSFTFSVGGQLIS